MQLIPSLLRKWRYGFLLTVLLMLAFIFYNCSTDRGKFVVHYAAGRHSLSVTSTQQLQQHHHHATEYRPHHDFPTSALDRRLDFNINGNDVVVFLHIQKTGGTTFGRHLTHDLVLSQPCQCLPGRKRCLCFRPSSKYQVWLFSRASTGWLCGLHADWTELQSCVPDVMDKKEKVKLRRRYFYITMIRNPTSRFISEWRHTQRGATWRLTRHMCNGRQPTEEELPPCYPGNTWMGVTLKDFLACPYNMAKNRQARMVADLSLVHCYNRSAMPEGEYERTLLASAKANLRDMAFFGLTEYQRETQYLFEQTFHIRFKEPLLQHNLTIANTSPVDEDEMEMVRTNNALDVELYAYAKDLFFQRYHYMKQLELVNKHIVSPGS